MDFRLQPAPRMPASTRCCSANRWSSGTVTCLSAVHRWPQTEVSACREVPSGEIEVTLSNGERFVVDHVLLATGYTADAAKVPYLSGVLEHLAVADGSPLLDESFQSSVPGLFFAGCLAVRDFGPFFAFVRGCPAAAKLIVRALTACAVRS